MKKPQQLVLEFEEEKKKPETEVKKNKFQPLGNLFEGYQLEDKGGYITQEFQDFGYRLAAELDDTARTSLYMRLSKTVKRALLEQALSFVTDAPNVKSKARLFMWKLKQLRDEKMTESKPSKTDKSD